MMMISNSKAAKDFAEYARQLLNSEVIRRTFPDGKLPDGTVVALEDGTPGVHRIDGVD